MKNYILKSNPLDRFPAIAKLCAAAVRQRRSLRFHIGLDTELGGAAVCSLVDGGNPRSLGKHSRQIIVSLIDELVMRGHSVAICQEACGFGPYLHRELSAAGATSYVVAPENLSGNRKTDRMDAQQLAQRLYDYEVHGNSKALRPVRDIGEPARMRRAVSRQRAQLQKARNQLAANARGLMHEFGYHEVPEGWWGRRKWPKLRAKLVDVDHDWLVEMIIPLHDTILCLHDRIHELEQELADTRDLNENDLRVVPKGVGDVTMDILESEVGDWQRFRNRGQASSYTGLCSGERSTGGARRQGSIDRRGNRRIRKQLVEAVWRMRQWNPGWRGFGKFPHVFAPGAKVGPATKKKAIVACARLLMVDLWRLNTRQTNLENLGLIPA